MRDAVDMPVTVKCRIGIDDQDPEATLDRFIDTVVAAGCRRAHRARAKGLAEGPESRRRTARFRRSTTTACTG